MDEGENGHGRQARPSIHSIVTFSKGDQSHMTSAHIFDFSPPILCSRILATSHVPFVFGVDPFLLWLPYMDGLNASLDEKGKSGGPEIKVPSFLPVFPILHRCTHRLILQTVADFLELPLHVEQPCFHQ